jgi:hypothetical protein
VEEHRGTPDRLRSADVAAQRAGAAAAVASEACGGEASLLASASQRAAGAQASLVEHTTVTTAALRRVLALVGGLRDGFLQRGGLLSAAEERSQALSHALTPAGRAHAPRRAACSAAADVQLHQPRLREGRAALQRGRYYFRPRWRKRRCSGT